MKYGEWTCIKDQLPPIDRCRYLCYFRFEPESPDVIAENFYYGRGHWLDSTSRVTHWMPLPEPPSGMPDYDKEAKAEYAKRCGLRPYIPEEINLLEDIDEDDQFYDPNGH